MPGSGATLAELLIDLRAELGDSLDPSHGVAEDASMRVLLSREQRRLYDEYMWPHMRARVDLQMVPGERFYDPPSGIDMTRLRAVSVQYGALWNTVAQGIDMSLYNISDSDRTNGTSGDLIDRLDPVERWDWITVDGREMIEVWPVPATATTLRFEGLRSLSPLSVDTDRADLDSQLLVLHTAAKVAARRSAPEAELLAGQASRRFEKLKAKYENTPSTSAIVLGAGVLPTRPLRRTIVVRP